MTVVSCRFCQREHPAGTVRCPVNGGLLPRRKTPSPAPADPPPSGGQATDDSRTTDPVGGGPDPHAAFLAGATPNAAAVTDLKLRVLPHGPALPLAEGSPLRLGRESSPLAHLCQDNVSRHHADIVVTRGTVTIVDAGSTNGTFVNDVKLHPGVPQVVARGDVVRLGGDPPVRLVLDASTTA